MDIDQPLSGNSPRSTTAMHAVIWKIQHGEFVRCACCFEWHQEAMISAVAVAELRAGSGQLVDNAPYAICDRCISKFLKSSEVQRAVWNYVMYQTPIQPRKKEEHEHQ